MLLTPLKQTAVYDFEIADGLNHYLVRWQQIFTESNTVKHRVTFLKNYNAFTDKEENEKWDRMTDHDLIVNGWLPTAKRSIKYLTEALKQPA